MLKTFFQVAKQKPLEVMNHKMRPGARYLGDGRCKFTVWAPLVKDLTLKIISPVQQQLGLVKDEFGYWTVTAQNVQPGARYFYHLNNQYERPDPASYLQPEGVHGPSEVVDHQSFVWDDQNWQGIPIDDYIIYELHVGTFTPEGTFEAIISKLPYLKELGVNAIELMPVAQFPGNRNWGYDGAYLYATQNSYGGPAGLKSLVNACHEQGMAVILDVVYNHLGPEGNYLGDYCPYYTEKYRTPWGRSNNFDDTDSDEVRNFFIQNALYWLEEFHIDAFRLDAVHAIYDFSARPFLQELAEEVEQFSMQKGRKIYMIAESDLSDTRIIRPKEQCGFGYDAQWLDDLHHTLHTLLTGERFGYYEDFGKISHLVKALKEGYVYSGGYSSFRRRRHGNSSKDRPGRQFVVSTQTHDQVGNRMLGERLTSLVSFEALKLAAGVMFLSPYIPMLFMGEEYAEDAPFLYFVSHGDPDLIQAVREGRKHEFAPFHWMGEPPDPQSEQTFNRSKLDWQKPERGKHKLMFEFYKAMLKLRTEMPALSSPDKNGLEVSGSDEHRLVFLNRSRDGHSVRSVMNFSETEKSCSIQFDAKKAAKLMDSADAKWLSDDSRINPGTLPEEIVSGQPLTIRPYSFVLYQLEK